MNKEITYTFFDRENVSYTVEDKEDYILFSVATPNEATIVEMMHKDFEDLVNELRKDWT